MEVFKIIGWFVWLLITIALVFEFVGYRSASIIFPESWRPWHLPLQLLSLVLFASAVLLNPWQW